MSNRPSKAAIAPVGLIIALLAAIAVSLWLLLPGGALRAQDAAIMYPENGTDAVATYTAVDPEGTAITSWIVSGNDAEDFTIVGGVLRFAKTPNYEMPADIDENNVYDITVQAIDSTGNIATEEVTVEVTNVDEAGKVTLSAQRPQMDTAFTAELSDPDGGVFDATIDGQEWQWALAGSKNGTYRNIDNATSETYTPKDADSNSYLRATVTYEDGQGEGKSAMMVSEFPSQEVPADNTAPAFDDDQDPVMDGDQAVAKRSVAENTAAGETIGSPVVATDADGDTLTYTLTGDDASYFDIDWGTGQILTKIELDAENEDGALTDRDGPTEGLQLEVVVRATDPSGIPSAQTAQTANSDIVTVMITVTDVNEAPAVLGAETVNFLEIINVIEVPLASYTALDPDAGAPDPIWSVGGADESKFNIDADGPVGSDLTFKETPDYENPTDANMDNVYEVTVQASDGKKTGMLKVMVTVGNWEEDGVVTLDKTTPVVGIPVMATLTDPDGGISKLIWEWSLDGTTIVGAESDTYTPEAGDVGGNLLVTANYFDGESALDATTKKTAFEVVDNLVELDTRNKPPVFGDEDPDTDGDQNTMATRKVDEGTEADPADDAQPDVLDDDGDNVGTAAVTATDTKADGTAETLTYTLSGADAAKFRVRNNGQIEVDSGTKLDYETKDTYMVTVTAEDPLGASSSIDVTIMVTDVDEAPDVSGEETPDYAENGTGPVATYTAVDPEGTDITSWIVSGNDAEDFTIVGGVLRFAQTPNYEMPADIDENNVYDITVQAIDSTGNIATEEVTVEVTNVDEAGKVTLSAQRPQTDTAFTAELSDPDGGVFDATIDDQEWQWALARSKNGTYRNIDNATSETYTPKDADSNSYLRATVTYEDGQGEGKSAMMVSEFPSQEVPADNTAPAFDDDQDPVMDGDQAVAKRSVAENTAAGETIGSPVVATDADGDTLTYTLTGDDASYFDIDWGTGQILTKIELDAENEDGALTDRDGPTEGLQLEVVVRATDPSGIPSAQTAQTANSDIVTVMITVTDVNEAPAVLGAETVNFLEIINVIEVPLASYTALDPDAGAPDPIWSVGGADESKFNIDADGPVGSDLTFKETPDYENPTDANMDNVYEVTVQASDGKKTGMLKVMVTVGNWEEDGVVTLDKTTPVVGIPVMATLTDPDGGISKLIWEWSLDGTTIVGAESDTYTPEAGDVGGNLLVTANYFDGESALDATTKKTAFEVVDNLVELDTRNKPPVFGDEDPDTDGDQNTMATRKVDEGTEADPADDAQPDAADNDNDNVGTPVAAEDTKADGTPETLTYSLSGADAAKFRVRDSGQIEVDSGTKLDYETKDTYMVTLTAEDPLGASSSIAVTIMVTDVDEAPEIMVGGLAISGMSSLDYAENGADMVATYSASGPEAASATWTLSGDDAGPFSITSSGVLTFVTAPDFENPDDADGDNIYMVTIEADDGTYTDTHEVTITVTDVDEAGTGVFGDTNDDGMIDKSEMIASFRAYVDGNVSKAQIIATFRQYVADSASS